MLSARYWAHKTDEARVTEFLWETEARASYIAQDQKDETKQSKRRKATKGRRAGGVTPSLLRYQVEIAEMGVTANSWHLLVNKGWSSKGRMASLVPQNGLTTRTNMNEVFVPSIMGN